MLNPIRVAVNSIYKDKCRLARNEFKQFEFPETLSHGHFSFKLVRSLKRWEYRNWDDSVLEFSRSLEFVNWRFLSRPEKYYLYLSNDTGLPVYFVVRNAAWRGLNLQAIVDYRVPHGDKKFFKTILYASKSLAKNWAR